MQGFSDQRDGLSKSEPAAIGVVKEERVVNGREKALVKTCLESVIYSDAGVAGAVSVTSSRMRWR